MVDGSIFMITVNSFISETLNTVDAVIGNLVQHAYTNFIAANTGVITLLFTVYVMFLGYQFLFHKHHFNMSAIMRHIIIMTCVYGLVMNWQLYQLFVYNIFTNEPGHIASIVINSAGTSGNIVNALDGIYSTITNATMSFFGQIGFSAAGVAFIVYGVLIFLIGSLMCVYALLLFIYAKMMMAVVLALGPIFILFMMWDSTRGLFNAWLNTLITLALIPIITSAILMLMISVINVTLPNVSQPADSLQFYGIAPFLGLSLATTLILSQVLRICSSLGGGITLASLSAGAAIASSALNKSGAMWAGRVAVNWSHKKIKQIKRRMF